MNKRAIFNGFTILVVVACLLTFFLNMVNDRFHPGDFRVYYTATANLISGEPVYMVSFYTGSGFYKYSPAILFFFLPYLCFNFKTAAIIHFFILGTAYWYTFNVIRRLIHDYFPFKNVKHELWLVSIAFACILIHFARELYLGNINIILLLLCCLSIRHFLTGKDLQGGILLGIVVLTKSYLLILLLPLIFRRKLKSLGWFSLTISCGLIIPFIFLGLNKGISMYHDWIKTILMHGGDFPGMTSIDYLLRYLFPAWPAWGIHAIFISFCVIVSLFIVNNIHREKQEGALNNIPGLNFMFEWFLLLALVPNLIKTDWVLLLFSAPLITFMVFHITSRKLYWWIPLLVILFFFYGANSDDLLGRELSRTILHLGLMGLSNLLLIIAALFMFHNSAPPPPFSRSSAHTSA